jgi:HD-GYP domain-containing protein (c-di-GMP phosphodiesterase class II)
MKTRTARTHAMTDIAQGTWREQQGWNVQGTTDAEPPGFVIETVASRPGTLIQVPSLLDELIEFSGVTRSLLEAVEAKDGATRGHCERVAELSRRLAVAAGCKVDLVEEATVCGLLHDVGKIGVPDHVLLKTDRLNDDEFEAIKKHSEIGERILGCMPELERIRAGVRSHHERWDGRGYPDGLAEHEIPFLGRIVGIVDAYDAMRSNRIYRKSLSRDDALNEIASGAGTQFDPDLAVCFLSLLKVEEAGAAYRFPRGAVPTRRSA